MHRSKASEQTLSPISPPYGSSLKGNAKGFRTCILMKLFLQVFLPILTISTNLVAMRQIPAEINFKICCFRDLSSGDLRRQHCISNVTNINCMLLLAPHVNNEFLRLY